MPPKRLPIFKGYTVDVRLKQFRKVNKERIGFIDFDSAKGGTLFLEYLKRLNPKSKEFKELIHNL